ncbi:MAG: 3-hydroxyacyl-CoA dehydrogenase family protein, partial [Longimicrobiales bacterium]
MVVAGAGTMGRGIAYVSALAGLETTLVDVDARVLTDASAHIERLLLGGVSRGTLTEQAAHDVQRRIATSTDLVCAGRATVVIEAIVERLDVKRLLFTELDAIAPQETLLASNTSSLSIASIAAATGTPHRVVGMHFF